MRKDKPAGPIETFVVIGFCVIPLIFFVLSDVQKNYRQDSISQSLPLNLNSSETDSFSETIRDSYSASYCYEIRLNLSHPKYQSCLDTALLCKEFLKNSSHQYYNDCKARGWSAVVSN